MPNLIRARATFPGSRKGDLTFATHLIVIDIVVLLVLKILPILQLEIWDSDVLNQSLNRHKFLAILYKCVLTSWEFVKYSHFNNFTPNQVCYVQKIKIQFFTTFLMVVVYNYSVQH